MVRTVPRRAWLGSVVGLPSGSRAQLLGMGWFFFWAAMMLPRATREVARSILTWKPLPVGKEAAMGLVPKKGSQAPSGLMAGSQLVVASRIMLWSAALLQ